MAEVSSVLAVMAAVALVALAAAVAHGWLRRSEARREEVRRLAWHAAEEAEVAERAESYCYGQYGGLLMASDLSEAPLLWTATPVAPAEASPSPPAPPAAGKRVCAMCSRQTTLRCKRCKSINYWSVGSRPSLQFSLITLRHCMSGWSLSLSLQHCPCDAYF
jgi:ubiquitin carboxyl-terminal hydrolase 36/42